MGGVSLRVLAIAAAATFVAGPDARAEDSGEAQFGKVHFETSCNEVAQRRFDRAMRYQHSFWYRASRELFESALEADPSCAIARWGVAQSLLLNPHFPAPADNLAAGLASLEQARAMGAKTQRERDYIETLLAFYAGPKERPFKERVEAYLAKVEELAGRYPDDDEAQIAYAIALNVAHVPTDKTYARQLKGAAILEPIFERQPRHPGVAHYLIHLYDYPPIAQRGLDAAKRYAQIAPAAPHAQHMPSHVFTRVGYWRDSIAANRASAQAAKGTREPHEQLHAMDYMVYAYLQVADDAQARKVLDEMLAVAGYSPDVRTGWFAVAASQARYAVERGDWEGAANLPVRPSRFPYADSQVHFARALGAARTGRIEAARADISRLGELRDKLTEAKDAYWAEQVDIQRRVAEAWLALAENRPDEALVALSIAADMEDRTEKSIVTPGPVVPARELLGAMLLERGMAGDARTAFETTLKKEPNRLGATLGAAKAAERTGDLDAARDHYRKATTLTEGSEASRPELKEAQAFLARRT
ncbi:tetratricopeptide repeat protein [Enterovirga sp. CN4-39]|uniref:tetratricopeptide repeat protein n=1 Tax=Enterovirga sp. CN4-39 TaxID=3400910 RepID=UPI003C095030